MGRRWAPVGLLVAVGLAGPPQMGLITLIVRAEKLLPSGRPVTVCVAGPLRLLGLLLTLVRPDLVVPIVAWSSPRLGRHPSVSGTRSRDTSS